VDWHTRNFVGFTVEQPKSLISTAALSGLSHPITPQINEGFL
jgi:hypothetical protein